MEHVDLHFHLLPGVDDGPADLPASLELARAAREAGTGAIVATPHVRPDLGTTDAREIEGRVRELRAALAAAGVRLEVSCGGELGHEMAFVLRQDELELLAQGPPARALAAGRDAVRRNRRGLPRGHRRAARARLRRAGGAPRAQRRRRARRLLGPAQGDRDGLARAAQRAVADRRPRRGRARGGLDAARGRSRRRGGVGRARADPPACAAARLRRPARGRTRSGGGGRPRRRQGHGRCSPAACARGRLAVAA